MFASNGVLKSISFLGNGMRDTMKAPVRITTAHVKATIATARQHLVNAELNATSFPASAARELTDVAEMLIRMATRMQAQQEIARIQSFPQPF